MFIKHVLGVGQDHPGLYGKTSAYYATVEQQGRLTLHLHMLLWILKSLSPQEIRDKIMDPHSDFQKKIVEYLESVHVGEFMTGTMEEVKEQVDENMKAKEYRDPLRPCQMHLQNLQIVTATNVNHVKITTTGGKILKILWMI